MSVASELSTLINTKEAIRNAINATGQSITTDTPFARYPDYIRASSAGVITDPKKYREIYRNENWPDVPEASEIDEQTDCIYILLDSTEFSTMTNYTIRGSNLSGTIYYYNNKNLVKTAAATISNSVYFFYEDEETTADYNTYNYVLFKFTGNITQYSRTTNKTPTQQTLSVEDMIEVQAKCSNFTWIFTNNNNPCTKLRYFGIIGNNRTDLSRYFQACAGLQAVTSFEFVDGCYPTDTSSMFQECYNLHLIAPFDTSHVTNIKYMFMQCACLEFIPSFDFSLATEGNNLFEWCAALRTVPALNMSNITNTTKMFGNCHSLEILGDLNLSSCTTCNNMFQACRNLRQVGFITLGNSNLDGIDYRNFFDSCPNLQRIGGLTVGTTNAAIGYFIYGCSRLRSIDGGDWSNIVTFLYPISNSVNVEWMNVTGISADIDLSKQVGFSVDAWVNVLNNLATVSGKTIHIGSANLNKLSAEQKAIATNKGWSLVA